MAFAQVGAGIVVAAVALTYALIPGYRAQQIYGVRFSREPIWWKSRLATALLTIFIGCCCIGGTWGSVNLILALPIVIFGSTLILIDFAVHRLPNSINLLFTCTAVAVLLVATGLDGDVLRLVRAFCAAGFFGLIFLLSSFVRGGVGLGDVKLAPATFGLAAAAGLNSLLITVFVTFISAGIVALVLLVSKRAHLSTPIALGPWMLFGLLVGLVSA